MANIYLRVSCYVAAFYRHRDEQKPLSPWDPVLFENFSYESVLLRQGAVSDQNKKFLTVLCYSQNSWKNICAGKLPIGGKTILVRDEKKWPTAREIVALEGRSLKQNEELFDYLCIELPRELMIGGQIVKADRNMSLDAKTAQKLSNVLKTEFYHYFYEWTQQELALFRQRGLNISRVECMERFYAQYEIPIAPGSHQKESMRMLAKRLFWRAERAKNHRSPITGEYFDYISNDSRLK